MRTAEGLDDASFSIGDGGRLLLVVLVLLLFGVSALARFGVLAVGRTGWQGSATRVEAMGEHTYVLSLSRSAMGMAREGESAMRATKSLTMADLEGMAMVGQ